MKKVKEQIKEIEILLRLLLLLSPEQLCAVKVLLARMVK